MKWSSAVVFTLFSVVSTKANAVNNNCSSTAPTLPKPIALADIPTTFAAATKRQPADTVAQILNTLSVYPLAIDGKSFASLSLVFTEDVITNYSAPLNVLTPLNVVEATLEDSLAPVDTQHAYGTQIVEVLDACTARSVSYYTASHFGKGSYAGQVKILFFCSLGVYPPILF